MPLRFLRTQMPVAAAVLLFPGLLAAQYLTMRGKVRDRNTYQPIPGVNILVQGTSLGTTTNRLGEFSLTVPNALGNRQIIFQHIGYERLVIPLDSLRRYPLVELQPRVISLPGVAVEATQQERPKILADLPQPAEILPARNFELRGYTDAADLLRNDPSIQVEEELSGKKTLAMRGGNSDDVAILFNGVKLNNAFDNNFDLSLIDLEDIARLEIVRGSNSSLYGAEAFSGLINIVPKFEHDYTLRFRQQLGTYQTGNYSLRFYRPFGRLHVSYGFKLGGLRREFADAPKTALENRGHHQMAQLGWQLPQRQAPDRELRLLFLENGENYNNSRDAETLDRKHRLALAQFFGPVFRLNGFNLSLSHQELQEDQRIRLGNGQLLRNVQDRNLQLRAEQEFRWKKLYLHWAYQYALSELKFTDRRGKILQTPSGLESARFQREQHGLVGIFKLKDRFEHTPLQQIELDGSIRADWLHDAQLEREFRGSRAKGNGLQGAFKNHTWHRVTTKFGIQLTGYRPDLVYRSYASFGSNVKFPTLFQQISSPAVLTSAAARPNLNPEQNHSLEIGGEVIRELPQHSRIYGWQVSGNFFQNYYDNKFRQFTAPGIPVVFYDNVLTARIAGLEFGGKLFLFRKKITLAAGAARYFISEKAAFPFKAENKRTLDLFIDHAGFSFQLHAFWEGEETGWLRQISGEFAQVVLPSFSNLDVHLSKTFSVKKVKFFLSASGRNLLNRATVLQGLSIRDRRLYLTLAAQI